MLTFDDLNAGNKAGLLLQQTDPGLNVTNVFYNANGTVAKVQRSEKGSDGKTVTESYLYSYLTASMDPNNVGMVASVKLQRQVNGCCAVTVQQVVYSYYGPADSFGNLHDLKTATLEDPSGRNLGETYYRYYKTTGGDGYQDGLEMVFQPQSFALMSANRELPHRFGQSSPALCGRLLSV